MCDGLFLLLFLLGLRGLIAPLFRVLERLFQVIAEILLDFRLVRLGDTVEDHDGDDGAGIGVAVDVLGVEDIAELFQLARLALVHELVDARDDRSSGEGHAAEGIVAVLLVADLVLDIGEQGHETL